MCRRHKQRATGRKGLIVVLIRKSVPYQARLVPLL